MQNEFHSPHTSIKIDVLILMNKNASLDQSIKNQNVIYKEEVKHETGTTEFVH